MTYYRIGTTYYKLVMKPLVSGTYRSIIELDEVGQSNRITEKSFCQR